MSPRVRETLVSDASDGSPAEVCGVLLGTGRESDTVRVTDSRQVPNVADDPRRRYELDPAATAAAFEAVEGDGTDADRDRPGDTESAPEVVGFYHSHPRGPPGPSATDRAQAQWPGYVYLIVSLATAQGQASATEASADAEGAEIGAWRWTGEAFETLAVRVASVEAADGGGDDRAAGEGGDDGFDAV
jgi:proteasome lid subunit RPN8/RPN11